MDVTKPYKFIGFGAQDATKPYRFIGFGASLSAAGVTTDVTATTGIAIIGPAPDFSAFVRYRWSWHEFLPAFGG